MSLALTSGITASAAPVATGDGNVFDADYYADNNPDVETAYGRDFNLLYQHFITFGAQEGRLPYAVGTDVSANLGITQQEADAQQTAEAQPEASQETVTGITYAQLDPTNSYGFSLEYPLPTVLSETLAPVTTTVCFNGYDGYSSQFYTTKDGYEWLGATFSVEDLPGYGTPEADDVIIPDYTVGAEGSYDWELVDSSYGDIINYVGTPEEEDDYRYFYVFTVSYNGVEYPAICTTEAVKYANTYNEALGRIFVMVPKGYTGLYLDLTGYKAENGQIIEDQTIRWQNFEAIK